MKKTLIIFSLVLLAACGPSQEEKQNIAQNACSIMGETKKSEAVIRLQTMSDAREKIGGETYIRGDDAIIEAFELGLCQQLVMNEDYEWYRNVARNRLPREDYHENGQLKSKGNYKDGKQEGLWEYYYENGQLRFKGNFKDGKQEGFGEYYQENGKLKTKDNYKDGELDGLYEDYHENGQLRFKGNFKDGKQEGLWEYYHENGQLKQNVCYKNGKNVDMSNCTE